ncbi:hypothetical protein BDZ89DRAFT_1050728 [Hymenopellis radicata]|nr:hypothetical protein BDZ89DRAFT_1050728 [Hymenopellis radicata]
MYRTIRCSPASRLSNARANWRKSSGSSDRRMDSGKLNNILGDSRFAHVSLDNPSDLGDIILDTLLFIDEESFKLPTNPIALSLEADQSEGPYHNIGRVLCRELCLPTSIIDDVDLSNPVTEYNPDAMTLIIQLTLLVGVRSVRKKDFIQKIELLQVNDRTAIMEAIQVATSRLETVEINKDPEPDTIPRSIPFNTKHTSHYNVHELGQLCTSCHTKDELCGRLEGMLYELLILQETEETLQETEQNLHKTRIELEDQTAEVDCLTARVGLLEERLQEKIGEISDLELRLIWTQEKSDQLHRAERENHTLNLKLIDQAGLAEKIKNLESELDEQRDQNKALNRDLAVNLQQRSRADQLSDRIRELGGLLSEKQTAIDKLRLELDDLHTVVAVQQANAERDRQVIDMLEERYAELTLSFGQMEIGDKVETPNSTYAVPLPGSLAQEFSGSSDSDVINLETMADRTELADAAYVERAPVDWRAWVHFLHNTGFSPQMSFRN